MSAALCLSTQRRHVAERFRCFGAACAVHVTGDGLASDAAQAALAVRARLASMHVRFSRFDPDSELSALNRDPHHAVRVSEEMAAFVRAAIAAAHRTGGLVDPTLTGALERAGYTGDLAAGTVPLPFTLEHAPPRRPGRPDPEHRWRGLAVDRELNIVSRPPGVQLDSGGLKGLFADWAAEDLQDYESYAIDCGGDLRLCGTLPRTVTVESPFDEAMLHEYELADGGVATSGIGRRSWLDDLGAPAHHVLDPSTGRPAFTGVVQVTALAPTALAAEVLAKAALLSGPDGARRWLAHGGVIVRDDGSHEVVPACA
jgi:thiamine biosynthesis lipoprotein